MAWGLDDEIYVIDREIYDKYTAGHTSIFSAGPVKFAGQFVVGNDGELLKIVLHSGHYKPQAGGYNMKLFQKFIMDLGVTPEAIKWRSEGSDADITVYPSEEQSDGLSVVKKRNIISSYDGEPAPRFARGTIYSLEGLISSLWWASASLRLAIDSMKPCDFYSKSPGPEPRHTARDYRSGP
eukprot:scaffold59662_cov27-Attheya_sp.AAC.1